MLDIYSSIMLIKIRYKNYVNYLIDKNKLSHRELHEIIWYGNYEELIKVKNKFYQFLTPNERYWLNRFISYHETTQLTARQIFFSNPNRN